MSAVLFLHHTLPRRPLHSLPTRRSSDLARRCIRRLVDLDSGEWTPEDISLAGPLTRRGSQLSHDLGPAYRMLDRKSTRLNSSHVAISYAVFCLHKKINYAYDFLMRSEQF